MSLNRTKVYEAAFKRTLLPLKTMCSQRRFGRCRNTDTRISTVMRFLSTTQQVLLTGLYIVKKDEIVLCERMSGLKVYPCSVYAY